MTYAGISLLITCYGLSKRTPIACQEIGEREVQRGSRARGPGYWHTDEVSLPAFAVSLPRLSLCRMPYIARQVFLSVMIHYLFYLMVVTFADPGVIQALGVRQEIGTMDHPVYNCNTTTSLVYPYSLSQVTPLLHTRFPPKESPKSPFKSRILPNGDLKIWKNPYLCLASEDPELR